MSVSNITETAQYLTFRLADEEFAIEILQVREVLDYTRITKVPRTPDFMRGVINLRGSVVPVIDLRTKFGMEPTEKNVATCIIIVEVPLEGETIVMGALADSVQEVVEMHASEIEPAPKIGTRMNTDFIRGMGKRGDQFIILLDIEKVFSYNELVYMKNSTDAKEQQVDAEEHRQAQLEA